MDLGNPKNTIEVIQKYNFAFLEKFGQNFLIDTHVLDKIISAAGMTRETPSEGRSWHRCDDAAPFTGGRTGHRRGDRYKPDSDLKRYVRFRTAKREMAVSTKIF